MAGLRTSGARATAAAGLALAVAIRQAQQTAGGSRANVTAGLATLQSSIRAVSAAHGLRVQGASHLTFLARAHSHTADACFLRVEAAAAATAGSAQAHASGIAARLGNDSAVATALMTHAQLAGRGAHPARRTAADANAAVVHAHAAAAIAVGNSLQRTLARATSRALLAAHATAALSGADAAQTTAAANCAGLQNGQVHKLTHKSLVVRSRAVAASCLDLHAAINCLVVHLPEAPSIHIQSSRARNLKHDTLHNAVAVHARISCAGIARALINRQRAAPSSRRNGSARRLARGLVNRGALVTALTTGNAAATRAAASTRALDVAANVLAALERRKVLAILAALLGGRAAAAISAAGGRRG